ncbi:DUF7245 domain-containing zinc-binding protein [Mycobacterium intracellulare]|uniref:Uncharacterized protein n=2 Tax=Mycobacterium intracellulare subsp. chimaera TaxID=222805 RepID=A0ABT7P8K6_MYCIT|nr:hypothetical protein [Mycobacterium intracellulare]MCF1814931.1 hypothetical protein [Mycobacterium intracellulare subsp. intracellulare]MDM3929578.1 hypothetical protein [Mycobacterium intracellulare subsp. chimaera]MDS0336857.1 hypothetical protein [Mycobacterium intracellulare]
MTGEHHLCCSCHELREIFYVDPVDRGHCAQCVQEVPLGSVVRAMQFLSLTIPFQVGDRVEAHTAGEIYDGIGHITEISFGHCGTPITLMFRVVIDKKAKELTPDGGWYADHCLAKVEALTEAGR